MNEVWVCPRFLVQSSAQEGLDEALLCFTHHPADPLHKQATGSVLHQLGGPQEDFAKENQVQTRNH